MANLEGPEDYFKALPELKNKVVNGCGPAILQNLMEELHVKGVFNKPFDVDFTEACNIHDWMYTFGNKNEADNLLFKNMITLIVEKSGMPESFILNAIVTSNFNILVRIPLLSDKIYDDAQLKGKDLLLNNKGTSTDKGVKVLPLVSEVLSKSNKLLNVLK